MAERLPRMNVGEMNLDERYRGRQQRIPQNHAGMGQATGIDDDESDAGGMGGVDAINQRRLGVALETTDFMSRFRGFRDQSGFNGSESLTAIDPGLTNTQHVQIRTVEDKNAGHGMGLSLRVLQGGILPKEPWIVHEIPVRHGFWRQALTRVKQGLQFLQSLLAAEHADMPVQDLPVSIQYH